MMRRVLLSISLLALVGLLPQTAWASTAGAHFMSASASVNNDGALVVNWDEAGLGNENISYTLTADATATYACINNGGNHPKASNKETVQGQVSTGGSFQAKNGRVRASLTTGPLLDPDFPVPVGTGPRPCKGDVLQHRAHGYDERSDHHLARRLPVVL